MQTSHQSPSRARPALAELQHHQQLKGAPGSPAQQTTGAKPAILQCSGSGRLSTPVGVGVAQAQQAADNTEGCGTSSDDAPQPLPLVDMDSLVQAAIMALQQQLSLNPDAPDLAALDATDRAAVGKSTIAALQQLLVEQLPENNGGSAYREAQGETLSAAPTPLRPAAGGTHKPGGLATPSAIAVRTNGDNGSFAFACTPAGGARSAYLPLTPGSAMPGRGATALPLTPASVMPSRKPEPPSTQQAEDSMPAPAVAPRAGRQAPRARVSDLSELMLALGHAIEMSPHARIPLEVSAHAIAILSWANTTFGGQVLNRVADELNADSTESDDSGEEEEVTSSTHQGKSR